MRLLSIITSAAILVSTAIPTAAEDIFRDSFEGDLRSEPLRHSWGDTPTRVETNAAEAAGGTGGSQAARRPSPHRRLAARLEEHRNAAQPTAERNAFLASQGPDVSAKAPIPRAKPIPE